MWQEIETSGKHIRKDVLILKNQQAISKFNVKSNRRPGEPQAPELGPGKLLNAESNNNEILALIFQRANSGIYWRVQMTFVVNFNHT